VLVSLFFTLSFCKAKRKLGKEKTFSKWVSEQLQKKVLTVLNFFDRIDFGNLNIY